MKLSNTSARTAIVCAVLIPSTAVASPGWDCIEPALQDELDLKLEFQDDFAEMVSIERPEFAEIASLGAEASKLNFTIRFSQISWLWNNDPDRFAEPDAFWVLSWSDDDEAMWLAVDPTNQISEEELGELQVSLRDHPKLPGFRSYVSENRAVNPYLELYVAFGENVTKARERVANCY